MAIADVPASRAAPAQAGEGMLDLNALWRAIMAHKFWILIPTALVLAATFVAVNLVTPRYTGEARILLESRDGFYTRPAGDRETTAERFDSEAVASQVQVILSRDVAREAIKRLKLVGNPEFDTGAGLLGSVQQLMIKLGLGRNPADRTPEDRVLEQYFDNLLVFPVARSRIIAIEFQSKDAELSARAANVIAAVYLESLEAAKKDTARGASTFLGAQILPLRQRVQEAEARVEEFRARAGLLIGSNNTTITQQQLADLSLQLSNARSIQADSQAKARLIRDAIRTGRTFEIPDVANNELVRRLIEQRVTMRAQIALESRTLLPEHPRIKELTAQITDLEGQIRAAAERTVRTLENEARIAGSRVETLTAAIDQQKVSVGQANESEVQLRALEREARAQRDQLEQFLIRHREALARDSDNASPADARVVSRAITPLQASFPKKLPTIAVATMATFFVALALVVSRELLSGRAMAAPTAMPTAPQPVAPQPAPQPPAEPAPPGAGRFSRTVRPDAASGDLSASAHAAPETAITSDLPDPGRDARRARVAGLITHAGRLAHVRLPMDDAGAWRDQLAALMPRDAEGRGVRILVLDAGTRAGGVHMLGAELAEDASTLLIDLGAGETGRSAGLSELLSNDASIADIISRDVDSRLHFVTAGRAGREAVVAAGGLLALALDAFRDAYEIVLVEASARDVHRLHGALSPLVDGAIVIADQVSNGHAVETAYKLCEGTTMPVAIAVFENQPVMPPIDEARRQPVPV